MTSGENSVIFTAQVEKFMCLFCVFVLCASMFSVGALAKDSSAVIEVGESVSFTHDADYAQSSRFGFSYQWEITSGGDCVKITSGATSLTCTVQGLAPGTAVLQGVATRSAYRVSQRLTDTITITVSPRSYIMTFDPNGGSVSTTSVPIYNGCTLGRMPTPTRSGYTFMGWFNQQSGGTQFEEGDGIIINGDGEEVPMYAQWKKGSVASPVKNTSPSENTALVTVDGKQYTFYLAHTSVTSQKAFFDLYTLENNSKLGKWLRLIIDHDQFMWETVATNDPETKLDSLAIYYQDSATDIPERCYYSSLTAGNNKMTLDMKSDNDAHLEGTFSGSASRLYLSGKHTISGTFNVTYGQTHTKVAGISLPSSTSVKDIDFGRGDNGKIDNNMKTVMDCSHCKYGECSTCNGNGYIRQTKYGPDYGSGSYSYSAKIPCPTCEYHDGNCNYCRGKGYKLL